MVDDLKAGESPRTAWPWVKTLPAMSRLTDGEIRYVVRCYGRAGFDQLPQGAEKRREYCMGQEGLTDRRILAGTHEGINAAAGEFIVWQNELKFEEYVSLLDLFHNVTQQARAPIMGEIDEDKEARAYDTKIKCANAAEGLRQKIEALRSEIFAVAKDDPGVVSRVGKRFSPEQMAGKNRHGKMD